MSQSQPDWQVSHHLSWKSPPTGWTTDSVPQACVLSVTPALVVRVLVMVLMWCLPWSV